MASNEYQRLEVEAAVKRAVSGIVTFKAASCKKYDAVEGKEIVKYLRECKKKISSELDEASIGVQGVQTRLKRNVRFESK